MQNLGSFLQTFCKLVSYLYLKRRAVKIVLCSSQRAVQTTYCTEYQKSEFLPEILANFQALMQLIPNSAQVPISVELADKDTREKGVLRTRQKTQRW